MKVTKEDITKYNNLLADFQADIRYIIRRFRRSFHILSEEEIASEVNKRLSMHKLKYIQNDRACLTKDGFSRFAYACTKNAVFWTIRGTTCKDERYRKTFTTCSFMAPDKSDESGSEWGFKVMLLAKEDSFLQQIDEPNNLEVILKWIRDYSDFLSDKEMIVFNDYVSGKPQRETAITINETRQSVAIIQKTVAEKIRSHIKVNINQDNSAARIKKGYESINHLFR
jgi:hypothetical protein